MISRRVLWAGVLLLAGCGGKATFGPESLPKSLDGGWTLTQTAEVPEAQWPDSVRSLRARKAWAARYQGPQDQRVTIYQLPAEASAFELVQKWRPVPGAVAFQHKALFVVVDPPSPGFVKALDRALP